MSRTIYRLLLPLEFPEGLAPGEGREGNLLTFSRDGMGRPVLRGTALAGALRHAWARDKGVRADDEIVGNWFGYALEGNQVEDGSPSSLRVPDCTINDGRIGQQTRTHNIINRHTGAVLGKGLFSIQTLPPKSRTTACLWLHSEKMTDDEVQTFLTELVGLVKNGLTLGGHSARGIGRTVLVKPARYKVFHADNIGEQAAWLDENREWRNNKFPDSGVVLDPPANARTPVFSLSLVLGIPASEDVLIGDGQGLDHEIEPQRIHCTDGLIRWKIPGSTLRGVFRGWFARLAARAGESIADSCEKCREKDASLDGNDLSWGFDDKPTRERKQDALGVNPARLNELVKCPIMRLFGSSYSKGRIHIGDAISESPLDPDHPEKRPEEQVRAHVAVDRITGGANEGFFFKNTVLTGNVRFKTTITLANPTEQEVQWLMGTLRALHLGILRVGTSKASGRLCLLEQPEATGCHAEHFKNFSLSEE
ncbi:MAG: RAMP superfamily CRISPR-associated protein [Kiritimatiellia bacterium]